MLPMHIAKIILLPFKYLKLNKYFVTQINKYNEIPKLCFKEIKKDERPNIYRCSFIIQLILSAITY